MKKAIKKLGNIIIYFIMPILLFSFLIDIYVHSTDKHDPRYDEPIEWKENTSERSDIIDDGSSSTTTTRQATTTKQTTRTKSTTSTTTKKATNTQETKTYTLTHYGPDCSGCGGTTASGYNVRNTIYYSDNTYGKIRVVAMKDLPLYSVIKIKNYKQSGDIIAIVLDKPKNYGIIDLLVESEKKSSQLGIQKNVSIDILRRGK